MKARARRTDPDTSHAAAASVGELTHNQQSVLLVFRLEGRSLLDEELIVAYKLWQRAMKLPLQSESGIRSRRSELATQGKLIQEEKRRMSTGGMGYTFTVAVAP